MDILIGRAHLVIVLRVLHQIVRHWHGCGRLLAAASALFNLLALGLLLLARARGGAASGSGGGAPMLIIVHIVLFTLCLCNN